MSESLTRRERRERERARRPQRGAPPDHRRGIPRIWVALGGVAVLALAAFGLSRAGVFATGPAPIDLNAPKYSSTEIVGTKFPDEGNAHVPSGQKATYQVDPPTSGMHWSQAGVAAAPWGIKDVTLPNEVIVHNLEHGGIVIFHKGLTADEQAKLTDLVRLLRSSGFNKIILEPYATMTDAKIALSAWDWGLKLQAYDDVPIVTFVKQHYQGPDAPERSVP